MTNDIREMKSKAEGLKPTVADAVIRGISRRTSNLGEQMGEVVQFIPKRDLDRARFIHEARAIYERIPTEDPASLQRVPTR
jgi:hypothetical protein